MRSSAGELLFYQQIHQANEAACRFWVPFCRDKMEQNILVLLVKVRATTLTLFYELRYNVIDDIRQNKDQS